MKNMSDAQIAAGLKAAAVPNPIIPNGPEIAMVLANEVVRIICARPDVMEALMRIMCLHMKPILAPPECPRCVAQRVANTGRMRKRRQAQQAQQVPNESLESHG